MSQQPKEDDVNYIGVDKYEGLLEKPGIILVAALVKRGIPHVTAVDVWQETIKPIFIVQQQALLDGVERRVIGKPLAEAMTTLEALRMELALL